MKKKTIMQYPLNAGRVAAVVFALGGLSILYFYVLGSMNASHAPTRVMVPVTTGDTESTTSKSTKSYQSASLNIAFEYPGNYALTENLNQIQLTDEKNATIYISKLGSQYNKTKDHIDALTSKMNKTEVLIEEKYLGSNEWQKVQFITESEQETVLFLVQNYLSYQISTKETLNSQDIELIARSFKILE